MLEKVKEVVFWSMVLMAPVLTGCAIVIMAVVGFAVAWSVVIFLAWEILKWFGLF